MPHELPIYAAEPPAIPAEEHRLDAAERWERLLDAGLIGAARQPAPPEHRANLMRTEAILRSGALYQRQLARGFAVGGAR